MSPEVIVGDLFIFSGGTCAHCFGGSPGNQKPWLVFKGLSPGEGTGFPVIGRPLVSRQAGVGISGHSQNISAKNTKGRFPCY